MEVKRDSGKVLLKHNQQNNKKIKNKEGHTRLYQSLQEKWTFFSEYEKIIF